MDKRSYTRLLAVQAFYSLSVVDNNCSNRLLLSQILQLQDRDINDTIMNYDEELFDFLLNKFRREKTILDSIIMQFINKDWNIERMDLMLLCIIRASVCELLYLHYIPTNIIIDEYVNLSSLFLKIDEINFVNAILCSVAKSVRKDEENQPLLKDINIKENVF